MGGLGDAGDGGATPEAGAANGSPIGGHAGDSGHVSDGGHAGNGGEGGEILKTPDAGAGGEAGAVNAMCDASVDLKMDPMNCGSCGHDCLGGECDRGQCQPFTIVPADGYIDDYVVVGDYVYWSGCNPPYTECFVARRRVDGSGESKILVHDEGGSLNGIAASATQLLWPAKDHVRTCDLPDCRNGAQDLVAAPNAAFSVVHYASGSQTLFWSGLSKESKRGLIAYPLSSSAPTQLNFPGSNDVGTQTSDERYVYWAAQSTKTDAISNADGAVWRARLTDLQPTVLASGLTGERSSVAVASDAVFLAGRYLSKDATNLVVDGIFRIPLPSGLGDGPLPLYANVSGIAEMVVVGDQLYWSNTNQGLIQRCPLAGCSSPEIIWNQSGFRFKHQGASFYWATFVGGLHSIVRVAK